MKKLLSAFTVLALTAGAALAADLPSRKGPPVLPPPPPPPLWTGFYVGLNAGATWTNSNQQTIGVGPISSFSGKYRPWGSSYEAGEIAAISTAASASGFNNGNNVGFIGGGQIGYNWQFYNSLVAGVEADIQGIAGNHGSRTVFTAVPGSSYSNDVWYGVTSVRGSLDYLGTVRGRLGWLFTPTLLLYGTGGLAYGGVTLNTATQVTNSFYNSSYANFPGAFGGVNYSNTQVGWTAGGGLEWMFWPNWSAKVEYLYYDLGSVTQSFALPFTYDYTTGGKTYNDAALFAGQVRARVNGNVVRAGLNYHFNWGAPAPVVAKY
jgi:outer membrane immunogenic protein